ncbi:flagellar hook-associated protein FlgL [Selenomonas sp. AB3002]|uniref:flagellar hook-associated protein FlgL n=1 Tax=Selenomonas sp. AB3002 TaxID=1392502 RepID=UPI000496AB99
MRVSSTQMIGRYQKQLNDSYEDQAKLMEQSDGSRLHRPSDDSVNYSKFLRYQNTDTENDQFQNNVKTGISWMKTADSAMANMKDLLTTIHEKTVQAATDTNDTSNIQAIGKDVLAKVRELVSLGNTQQGDRYMFAGQSDLTQPFTITSAKVERGLTKTLDDPQKAFFSTIADSKGNTVADSKGNMTQMLVLNGDDGNTYYLSTTTGKVYTREFMDEGYKRKVGNGQTQVMDGDEVDTLDNTEWSASTDVSIYFDKNGQRRKDPVTKENVPFGKEIEVNGNTVKLEFATIEQYVVEYTGDDKKISMVKRNGTTDPTADTVNVTGQDLFGSDIFDNENSGNQVNGSSGGTAALNDLLQVIAKMEAGDVIWLSSDGLTATDKAHVQVVEAETSAAARQNVYDSVSTMLDKQNETITEDISNCSDADVAKLAIDLMTMQTIYNMSLSVGSRILPQSLADYL